MHFTQFNALRNSSNLQHTKVEKKTQNDELFTAKICCNRCLKNGAGTLVEKISNKDVHLVLNSNDLLWKRNLKIFASFFGNCREIEINDF